MAEASPKVSFFSRLKKSEALLIAIVPFAGTFISFVFEAGYLSFYDVPVSLAQIDLFRIISASALVALFLLWPYLGLLFIVDFCGSENPLKRALLGPFLRTLFFGLLIYFASNNPSRWLMIVGIFLFFATLELLPPLFSKDRGTTYLQRLAKQIAVEKENNNSESSNQNVIDPGFEYLAGFFLLSIFISMIGNNHAREKSEYWGLPTHPHHVIVEIYGDVLILKPYDPQTKIIGPELVLISYKDAGSVTLTKLKTGALIAPKF